MSGLTEQLSLCLSQEETNRETSLSGFIYFPLQDNSTGRRCEAVVSGRQCVFVAQCVTVELNSTVTSWKFHRTKKKTRALGLN